MAKFKLSDGIEYEIKKSRYVNGGGNAYIMFTWEEGYEEEFMSLSVNLDELTNEGFWVKEHEGFEYIQMLISAGIITLTGEATSAGYGKYLGVRLTEKGESLVTEDLD